MVKNFLAQCLIIQPKFMNNRGKVNKSKCGQKNKQIISSMNVIMKIMKKFTKNLNKTMEKQKILKYRQFNKFSKTLLINKNSKRDQN